MNRVQVIEKDGKPDFYVVPAEVWEHVKDMVEAAEDAAAYAEAVSNDDGFRIPHAVVKAELDGITRVRAWRKHNRLTLQALADAAGLSKAYVSQIEGGRRIGTAATMKKLAAALGVPLDALLPEG
jgi:antitoxin component HigA of HigAB toxin-antitoxin module